MFDGKAFGAEIVSAVKAHMADSLAPILKRVEALEAVAPQKGEKGDPGKDGAPGQDAEPVTAEQIREAVLAMPGAISEAVASYLSENPPPAGKDGVDGQDGKDGVKGEDGRDGLDVKDMFRADGGRLVAVMSDGTTRDLGEYVGKDGKDGAPGRDGADGVGFDDMDLVETDDGLSLRFVKGEVMKEFPLPVPVDRGVWKPGAYRKGSFVTWAGSGWIAQEDTYEKPDTGKGWRLAVKKGRDGKDKP